MESRRDPKEHYFNNYDTLRRFITYYYQIDLTRKLKPEKILEIGIGNKTITNYFKQNGFNVTTCDYDESLEPDHVADIRKLPFKENSYDVINACEILEHLPWNDVDLALEQLHKVTKKYVIISIPYTSFSFEFIVKIPLIGKLFPESFLDLFFRIPRSFKGVEKHGGHYWEIGRKNYNIKKVRKLLEKRFRIMKEVRPVLNGYHYFFVLEKRNLPRK